MDFQERLSLLSNTAFRSALRPLFQDEFNTLARKFIFQTAQLDKNAQCEFSVALDSSVNDQTVPVFR